MAILIQVYGKHNTNGKGVELMAKSTIVNLNDVPNEETPLAMKEADEIITGKVKSKPTNHSPRR